MEGAMDARLRRLAREVESRPDNAAGRDKTWVLHAMWQYVVFLSELKKARRVDRR